MKGSFRRSSLLLGATMLLCTALLICNPGGLSPAGASPRLPERNAQESSPAKPVASLLDLTITGLPVSTDTLAGDDVVSGSAVLPTGSNGYITITLSADPTSIVANGISTSTLTAALEGVGDGTVVTFTTTAGTFESGNTITDTASGGSAQAILTSDTLAQMVTVTAEVDSVADSTSLTFAPGPLHHFAVDVPATGTAGVGFTTVITALDEYDNTVTSFTDSVTLATTNGGTINPATTGAFTAGVWSGLVSLTTAGDDREVTAQSGSASGTGYIDIQPGPLHHVAVSPLGVDLHPGHTQQFAAHGYDQFNNEIPDPGLSWAVVNGGGTINASGLFTAGTTIGAFPNTVAAGNGTITGTASVTVTNQPPTAVIGGPSSGPEGSGLTWNASASSDPENDALTYAWDFGDGSAPGNVITVTHTYTDDAGYTLTLTVTDAYNASDTATSIINIYNVAPTVVMPSAAPEPSNEGSAVTASATFSDAGSDDGPFTCIVNYGDGSGNLTGTVSDHTCTGPSHVYADNGPYTVTVSVTDKDAGTGSNSTSHVVNNVAPTASASNNGPVAEGSLVTVTASQTDPGADTFTYSFDWTNDGSWEIVNQTESTATHVYTDDGDYTVRVRVLDDDGGSGLTTTAVSVYNITPTAIISGPVSGFEGSVLTWDASLSTDPGADVLTYTWSFGDGSAPGSGLTVTHTYTDNGSYILSLTVTDDENASDTVTRTISISNVDPVANAGGPYTGTAGVSVFFDASGSHDPGAGDTLTYEWDFDNNGQYDDGVGMTAYYTWTAASYPNPYIIGLRVTDDDGGTGTVTTTVNIQPGPLDHFSVTTPGSSTAGVPFLTYISPLDEYNNILRNWNNTVTLTTTNGGTINPTEALGSAFVSGTWTGNVSLTRAGDNRTVVASYGDKTGTGYININPAGLHHIRIEHLDGTEFITATLVVRQSLTVYSRGYDQYDNLRGSQVVTWTGTGPANGYLTPTSGTSTTFTPQYSGTATIQATCWPTTTITDTTGNIIVTAPVLNLTKRDSPDPVEAGALLSYTITYSNTGNAAATNFVITETLDNHLTFQSSSPASSGTSHVRTWSFSSLAPDGPHQIVITASVDSPLPNGTVLTSTTQMDSEQTDPVVAATVTTTVHSRPVLSITKTDLIDPVDPGSEIPYRIQYSNSGNEDAYGVVITDYVPISTTFSHTAGNPPGVHANRVVTWNVGLLEAGSSKDVYLYVTVDSPLPAGTVITNTGYRIDCDQTAPVVGADVTTTVKSPDLKVHLTGTPDPVDAGQRITYTLTYTNTGQSLANDVVLSDHLPPYTTLAYATPGYNYANGVVSWTVGALPKDQGGSRTLAVRVTSPLTNGTSLVNTAYIDSFETEPSGDSLVTYVRSRPQLYIAKRAGLSVVEAGGTLTYTITYSNTGNANATNLVITDTYDAHVNFVSASPMPNEGNNVWKLGLLPGEGGSGTIVVTVTVDAPLTDTLPLTNLVEMTCREITDTYHATAIAQVNSAPVLGISLQDQPDPVHAGQIITYSIAYSNTGNANATNTVITATWDSRLGSISAKPAPTSGNNVWRLGQLNGLGGYGTIVVTATVNGPLPPEAVLSSTVRMSCSQLAGTVSDSEQTQVNAVDLRLIASYDDNTVYPGKWITYTLFYTNTGDVPAGGVVLTATRPAYTDYRGSGWSTANGTVYTRSLGILNAGASGNVQFVVSIITQTAEGGSLVLPAGLAQIEPTFTIGDNHNFGPDSNSTDNASSPFIGVPDLVIEDVTITPETLLVGMPVTFTVRVRNQGTGPAWNPSNKGGFYVNVFVDKPSPPLSYPAVPIDPGDTNVLWGISSAIYPGQTRDVHFTYPGFSTMEGHSVYVKVDNYDYPTNPILWQRASLVPESDESNNVFGPAPVIMGQGATKVYLPIVLRNYH
ncbi:MAG: PKD domain-containing protein [Anaerolineae bacterium]|nr:PKD domain-containing protein [Anaerolineae bacterium]